MLLMSSKKEIHPFPTKINSTQKQPCFMASLLLIMALTFYSFSGVFSMRRKLLDGGRNQSCRLVPPQIYTHHDPEAGGSEDGQVRF